MSKTDFDNKLTSFNRRITSNKTKHLEVQKKLNSLITKDYNFFLGRIYVASHDGSKNTFFYQPTFNELELKSSKATECIISWKSKRLYNSKLIALQGASLPNGNHFRRKIEIQFNSTP